MKSDWSNFSSISISPETPTAFGAPPVVVSHVDVWEDLSQQSMVLMNNITGFPILSVRIKSGEGGLLVQRGDGVFQYVFQKDKQEFGFRLTNFTRNPIAFHIKRGQGASGKVINHINLLAPDSTYDVDSDTSNEERVMSLDILESKETVPQDEANGPEEAKGTYFSIMAYPSVEIEDWTGAYWCSPRFIAQTSSAKAYLHKRPSAFSWGAPANGGWEAPFSSRGSPAVGWGSPVGFGGDGDGASGGGWGASFSSRGSPDAGGWGVSALASTSASSVPQYTPAFATSATPVPQRVASFGAAPQAETGGFGFSATSASASDASNPYMQALGQMSASVNSVADSALAAEVSYGEVKKVGGRTVNETIYYDKGSPVAITCLSVMDPSKIVVLPVMTHAYRVEKAFQAAQDYFCGKNERLLASVKTVYMQDECCICLESTPDCIFARCGHAAVCDACLIHMKKQECPLCREFVVACISV